MAADPLDDVLNIEDRFYKQGYEQGLADGVKAGRVEGRSFGMQTGYGKFLESGRLAGKSIVWANRMSRHQGSTQDNEETSAASASRRALPSLASNARLEKNIGLVYALVEPDTLSTQNSDEAVQDFDDRVKRAQGKAKIVEKMISGGPKEGRLDGGSG